MKRVEPQSIRQIIDAVIDASTNRSDILEQKALSLWPEIVGQGINHATYKRYVRNGAIHVFLNSASLKSEVSFSKSKIIDAMNNLLGQEVIKDLVIH